MAASLIVDWDPLQAGLAGAGTLPDGTTLSPAATLAALCDAGIIPMVFDGPGRPLHVGRPAAGSPPPNAAPWPPGTAAAPGRAATAGPRAAPRTT